LTIPHLTRRRAQLCYKKNIINLHKPLPWDNREEIDVAAVVVAAKDNLAMYRSPKL
jgi:hypothetical protein